MIRLQSKYTYFAATTIAKYLSQSSSWKDRKNGGWLYNLLPRKEEIIDETVLHYV
jgi:hypothetical protein